MQNKSTHPEKKAQKALQTIKKKVTKKAQKSTTVLLKALTTNPCKYHLFTVQHLLPNVEKVTKNSQPCFVRPLVIYGHFPL